jgi:flagella synthesis protein FlgN
MQAQASTDARLVGFIADELDILRGFVDLLQHEQQILGAGAIDEIAPLIEEKTRLASLLTQLAEQRNEALAAAGLPHDRQGVEAWLKQRSPADETTQRIHSHWENILALASQARALNETSGKLIGTRLQHNQQTLNALLTAGNRAALYGPDGQPHAGNSGRSFGAV